jgi:hypothetical protein
MRRALPAILLLLGACAADQTIRYPVGGGPVSKCTRGNPKPILSKANPDVLSTYFKLTAPGRSRERARLKGRVKLTLLQNRCGTIEHLFAFELPLKPRRLDHLPSWYRRAALLLEAISDSSPAREGLVELALHLREISDSAPAFGTPVEMGEFQRVSVQVGEDLKGTRTIVEIRYTLKV